ncbi:MAG: transposase [Okeania sp. SIO2B3]|nr:transposase [Okeania sp. SIO2B3]
MVSCINSRMVVTGVTYSAYLPPYSTVFWLYLQWRASGVIEKIRDVLHSQVCQ